MMSKWLSAVVCSMLVATPAGMALAQAPAGSKADHEAAIKQADADYKAASARCDGMKDNAKDVCKLEAKRDRDVARADADARHEGTEKAHAKAMKTKADRDYDVAKEMCDDRKGNEKDVCVKDAKAAHERALGTAKIEKAAATGSPEEVAQARRAAQKDNLDAAYEARKERCDAMSGDARSQCQADVAAKFGK
ncbi:MAG: hypothetical protein AAB419_13800 [Pseudomonadota bacterium]